jgi:transcriptional regulator with XRE-family HTH domain
MNDRAPFSTEANLVTLLYSLEPRCAGTGFVESIFSYEMSLAYEHCVSVLELRRFLLPDKKFDMPITDEEVSRLVAATGRKELQFSTMRTFLGKMHMNAYPTKLRVCLDCCREDISSARKQSFGRLLWEISIVQCCPIHGKKLLHPNCARGSSNVFRRISLVGVCSSCGSIGYRCCSQTPLSASSEEIEVALVIKNVIANASKIAATSPFLVKKAVDLYISEHGGKTKLAKDSGVSRAILRVWLHNSEYITSLKNLIYLAQAMGVELSYLLCGELKAAKPRYIWREKARSAKIDALEVSQALESALTSGASAYWVAKAFQCDPVSLKTIAPELFARVVERARHCRKVNKANRLAQASSEVISAFKELNGLGKKLSVFNTRILAQGAWAPMEFRSILLSRVARTLDGKTQPAVRGTGASKDVAIAAENIVKQILACREGN